MGVKHEIAESICPRNTLNHVKKENFKSSSLPFWRCFAFFVAFTVPLMSWPQRGQRDAKTGQTPLRFRALSLAGKSWLA
jgi:hypothetical protein